MNGHATRRPTRLSAQRAEQVVGAVPDPEMPYVTLADLGIVVDVTVAVDERAGAGAASVHVQLLPTYLGCPATEVIRHDVEAALIAAGWDAVTVELRFDPPWTPDRITEQGRAKLAAEGIAPPAAGGLRGGSGPVSVSIGHRRTDPDDSAEISVQCPQCGAPQTELLSAFGPAPCQELRRCTSCREPFPAIKAAR